MSNDNYEEEDEDGLSEDEKEERVIAREALKSAELGRIMARAKAAERSMSFHEKIIANWTQLGAIGKYVGYSGCLCTETMLKSPKKYKGKIKLYDSFIAVFCGGKMISIRKITYRGGFRMRDADAFKRAVYDILSGDEIQ